MRRRWIVATVVAFGFAMVGCKHADDGSKPAPLADVDVGNDRDAPVPAATKKPAAEVLLTPADGGEPVKVYVEVVRSRRAIRRGLMYRQHLPPDQGMLFLMGEEKIHTFWMKNTLVPLDMFFIKRDKTVAGVVENVEPLTKKQRFVDEPSYYVLEVNAGWAKKHGIGAGASVTFVGIRE